MVPVALRPQQYARAYGAESTVATDRSYVDPIAGRSSFLPELSIVIPLAPDERQHLHLVDQLGAAGPEVELILVRCTAAATPLPPGSCTTAGAPLRVVDSVCGRARQLDTGVRAARAPRLWFLHADSQLPSNALTTVVSQLQRWPGSIGYFDLAFAADGPRWVWLNALGARLRSRWLGLPFGDQGLFMDRFVLERLGGFDTGLRSGEDHELIWRAHRHRVQLRSTGLAITTSARRYADRGWFRTTARHLYLTATQAWQYSARTRRR